MYVIVIPGMSDHEAVRFEVFTKLYRDNLQPRKVYHFHKADKEAILVEASRFMESFFKKTSMNGLSMKTGVSFK